MATRSSSRDYAVRRWTLCDRADGAVLRINSVDLEAKVLVQSGANVASLQPGADGWEDEMETESVTVA